MFKIWEDSLQEIAIENGTTTEEVRKRVRQSIIRVAILALAVLAVGILIGASM